MQRALSRRQCSLKISRRFGKPVGVAFLSSLLFPAFSLKMASRPVLEAFEAKRIALEVKIEVEEGPSRRRRERVEKSQRLLKSTGDAQRNHIIKKQKKQPKPADASNDPRIARAVALKRLLSPAEMLREDGTIDQDFFKPKQVR